MRGVYAAIFDRPYGDELVYVGSALVLERRWAVHERKLRKGVHENSRFQHAYDKYGKFRWEVLEQLPGADEDELLAREQFWYDKYLDERGKVNLLNLMRPERYPMADPEVRERHAEAQRRLAQDPEWRANHAEAHRRLAQDPEWRANKAEANRRLAQDPEWRAKTAAAVAAACAKRYVVTTPDGDELEVSNLAAFCREEGLHNGAMVRIAQGKRAHHKGWRCRYADEEDDYDEEA